MRKWAAAVLAATSIMAVGAAAVAQSAQSAGQTASPAVVRPPIKVAAGATEVIAPMRDGVKLAG
ncbi:MAG TPA: hypothetical protein VIA80_17335, partial [Hyphomonadaceae bacterium]